MSTTRVYIELEYAGGITTTNAQKVVDKVTEAVLKLEVGQKEPSYTKVEIKHTI